MRQTQHVGDAFFPNVLGTQRGHGHDVRCVDDQILEERVRYQAGPDQQGRLQLSRPASHRSGAHLLSNVRGQRSSRALPKPGNGHRPRRCPVRNASSDTRDQSLVLALARGSSGNDVRARAPFGNASSDEARRETVAPVMEPQPIDLLLAQSSSQLRSRTLRSGSSGRGSRNRSPVQAQAFLHRPPPPPRRMHGKRDSSTNIGCPRRSTRSTLGAVRRLPTPRNKPPAMKTGPRLGSANSACWRHRDKEPRVSRAATPPFSYRSCSTLRRSSARACRAHALCRS